MRTLIASFVVLLSLSAAAMACPQIMQGRESISVTGQDLVTPNRYSVSSGGSVNLLNCGFDNRGYVDSRPDFSFYTSGMQQYDRLEIDVYQQACDTVLVVNSANSSWFFDDDSRGQLRPRVNLYGTSNTQGRIDVWVGTYGRAGCVATLELQTYSN